MWFEPKKEGGERCGKCKGTGRVLEIAVGLGNQTLVPAYVETICPKCKGDGFVSTKDAQDWKTCKAHKATAEHGGVEVYIPCEHEYPIRDSFFLEKWLTKLFKK
jgi:DnaJ-class molecular chaperone